MRLFSFSTEVARPLTHYATRSGDEVELDPSQSGASIAPLARATGGSQVVCMYVGAGGEIGRHPTVGGQLFCVVEGAGWVSGADGDRVAIQAGQAAFWEGGEEHASGSDEGMTAIVFEGPKVRPSNFLRELS